MGTAEARERLEFMLEQTNPRLHLYTLAQKRALPALASGDSGFLAAMQEISSVKTGS
jgi:hypothetical protein